MRIQPHDPFCCTDGHEFHVSFDRGAIQRHEQRCRVSQVQGTDDELFCFLWRGTISNGDTGYESLNSPRPANPGTTCE
jgi:hypothetical protein